MILSLVKRTNNKLKLIQVNLFYFISSVSLFSLLFFLIFLYSFFFESINDMTWPVFIWSICVMKKSDENTVNTENRRERWTRRANITLRIHRIELRTELNTKPNRKVGVQFEWLKTSQNTQPKWNDPNQN